MIIDGVSTDDLPEGREAAFVEYDKRLRAILEKLNEQDIDRYTDSNGVYHGEYEPRRFYVSSILAFLDEYDLDQSEIVDISALPNTEFSRRFPEFFNKINYLVSRYKIRASRFEAGSAGTPITFSPSYKEEIGKLLETIRKIVNQEVADPNKKDAIFKKISSLQSEVDRDRTTVDAVFSRLMDLSRGVGEAAENVEPLIEKLERLKGIFFSGAEKQAQLPSPNRKKALPPPPDPFTSLDDEIPF